MKRWTVPLLALLAACSGDAKHHLLVTGQIEGVTADAGSKLGGRVTEVLVREGDAVNKGDILVRLETDEAAAKLAAAKAQLAQAEAMVAKLEHGARPQEVSRAEAAAARAKHQYEMALNGSRAQEKEAARAAVAAARAQRDQARADYDRAQRLYEQDVMPRQLYDQARHGLEAAEAQLEAARERQNLVEEGTREERVSMAKAAYEQAEAFLSEVKEGARQEDVAAGRAARDAAAAAVQLAEVGMKEMTINAPFDGFVEALDVDPGDLVKPGALIRIADPERLELTVFVSAGALGHIKRGDAVTLTTDSLGDETFEGEVIYIATQGEFTPRNLQTQEERVQQMFGVKVALDSAGGRLKAGMSATVHFDLRREAS